MITVSRTVYFQRSPRGRRVISAKPPARLSAPHGRIPRVARLMALALHFERLIRDGKVGDQSDLARLCRVTQPRMTQILNLTLLAPDIIEELLHLPPAVAGRDAIHEKLMRPLAAECNWVRQRAMWCAIRRRSGPV